MSPLVRIVSPYFVAGVLVGERAAPIVSYMRSWPFHRIVSYCRAKQWTVEIVP